MKSLDGPVLHYNVGGRVFMISRELVDRHPTTKLAILAKIQEYESEVLFFDGNSERFEYLLDYVRFGKVVLLINISIAVVREDLDFYGFETQNMHYSGILRGIYHY